MGYAFVRFQRPEDVEGVLQSNPTIQIGGHSVQLDLAYKSVSIGRKPSKKRDVKLLTGSHLVVPSKGSGSSSSKSFNWADFLKFLQQLKLRSTWQKHG